MIRYKGFIQYSEASITALCKTQHSIYNGFRTFLIAVVCVAAMSFAVTAEMSSVGRTAVLAIGGIALAFSTYPPVYKAKATISGFHGIYPSMEYRFCDSSITIKNSAAEKTLEYGSITRLQIDDTYLYLFLSKTQAYMMELSTLEPNEPEPFLSFLSEKTECYPHRSRRASRYGIRSILTGNFKP